jgi:hypothetical protein
MYLAQFVAFHAGQCGNERAIVADLAKANRTSSALAQFEVDQAVRGGQLVREPCRCK